MDQTGPLAIGCHHKTGTKLLAQILKVVGNQLRLQGNIIIARSEERKLPFSFVLKKLPKSCCYINTWFEHEMDVPASSVRFLHFVRHPADRIRSAYLYHAAGGPGEAVRWLDFRIFRVFDKAVSYYDLLNIVDDKTGLLIEAIRCYPEIAGTARAAHSSAHLTRKLEISLEQIATDFEGNIRAACEFMGLDKANARMAVEALKEHDISKKRKSDLPNHVTRFNPEAENLKNYLVGDPAFYRLYSQCIQQTGFECCPGQLRTSSRIDDDLLANILDNNSRLLTDFRTESARMDLRYNKALRNWLPYALQTFGEGGHLMMYEFLQTFIDRLNLPEPHYNTAATGRIPDSF